MKSRLNRAASRLLCACACSAFALPGAALAAGKPDINAKPDFRPEIARDISRPLSTIAVEAAGKTRTADPAPEVREVRIERDGPQGPKPNMAGDSALQNAAPLSASITPPLANFEGLSNADNAAIFGFRVNPPDPVGAAGPNHYVEMTNLAFAVYDKTGNVLTPPTAIGALWDGFAVPDCTDASGDPIVVYDQFNDRWILSQFTTRGLSDPNADFYNCVAISATGDPTGAYYRYAFNTGKFFPDYPKYGLWKDSYVITTREFGPTVEYGIGIYALELNKMVNGQPARSVGFFLDGNDPAILPLVGDGLLPAYIDGKDKPKNDAKIPIVGTQDDGAFYGATFDAVNIFDLDVKWRSTPAASLELAAQLPVASFDSIFPCAPTSRDCLPQPGIANPAQFLDVLSYRQRPLWRLAYRQFKSHEAMVTSQAVEASPGIAGMRWYEIRRENGAYSIYQQGTYAPGDGVHRWMGSAAMDRLGNIGLAYSVVNGTNVYPGIRYTGRLAGDPLGQMTLGEGVIIDGTGVQTTTNSRWGDYTSLNPDPVDDCTLWHVNEYYTAAGQASSPAGWQTRIASFKLPGCTALD